MTYKIKITKMIHPLWKNHQEALENPAYKKIMRKYGHTGFIGKYKFDYESPKGKISLISLPKKAVWNNKTIWEIYAYENEKLFSDVERFDSKKEAENRIKELLK